MLNNSKNLGVLKVLVWDVDNTEGSLFGIGILIKIWMQFLTFDRLVFRILTFSVEFKSIKNHDVLNGKGL